MVGHRGSVRVTDVWSQRVSDVQYKVVCFSLKMLLKIYTTEVFVPKEGLEYSLYFVELSSIQWVRAICVL